jgi:hypothetical protein
MNRDQLQRARVLGLCELEAIGSFQLRDQGRRRRWEAGDRTEGKAVFGQQVRPRDSILR